MTAGGEIDEQTALAQVERRFDIAERIALFVLNQQKAPGMPRVHVFVEDAVGGLAGMGGLRLAELAGAVKHAVYSLTGLECSPVNVNTARKYLLGKLPKKDRAVATHAALRRAGCPVLGDWSTADMADSFAVASYGRTEIGLPGLVLHGGG